MKNFWGIAKKDNQMVGCTGQTVYLYKDGTEIAKFKDIKYGYTPMFCPNKNIFVVKSTDASIAVYSLDELKLIRKFRCSKVTCAQDDGFCFSPDGEYFYNIERHIDSCKTRLTVYDTRDFQVCRHLFEDDYSVVLSHIEFDMKRNSFFVLGFIRGSEGVIEYGFVSAFVEDKLEKITRLTDEEYEYIQGYKALEIMGFTEKAKEWSGLKYDGYNLENIEQKELLLSDYV